MSSPLLRGMMLTAGSRIPFLRALPLVRLLALAEIALLAREHLGRLEPRERRRLVEIVRAGRGRPGNLSPRERQELFDILAKIDPKAFMGAAAERFSPVSLGRKGRRSDAWRRR